MLTVGKMKTRRERAVNRLVGSIFALGVFFLIFRSQLGGGPNVGGVFPAPLLIVGLLGMPVAAVFVIVSALQVFLYRKDGLKKKAPNQPAPGQRP